MQNFSLIQKLQHIVQEIQSLRAENSSEDSQISNHWRKQVKDELQKFYQFSSQQIIKLSAYYETKLQYQAIDYEEEISCLKQQIERQYKVIGLMKLELEDLVVLVNQQRNHSKSNKQHQGEDQINNIEERMRDQQEHKEWRVKKSESALIYTQKPSNHNNNIYDNKQDAHKSPLNQSQQCPPSYGRSVSTISGLQIIAEEQTQRTLMSAGDQQGYPIEPDYFENDQNDQNNQEQLEQIDQQKEPNTANDAKAQIKREQWEDKKQVLNIEQKNLPSIHMRIEEEQDKLQQCSEPQINKNITHQNQNPSSMHINSQPHQNQLPLNTKKNNQNDHIDPFLNQTNISHNHQPSLNHLEHQEEQSQENQQYYSESNLPVNRNHSFNSSMKPQLRFAQNSQKLTIIDYQKQQRINQKTNFVQNPFAKKVPQSNSIKNYNYEKQPIQYSLFNQQPQSQQNNKQQKESCQQLFQKQAKIFLKQYHPQFTQLNKHISKPHTNQKPKSIQNSNVMSILQMIATSNFQPHSKRSQRSNKLTSSRSKSKSNKQSKKSLQKKSSAKKKKHSNKKSIYYNYQTEEQPEIDSENNSRFTMVRCPTSEDITQRNNPKSFDQTECFTSNDFRAHSEYESYDKDLKSFHTTFGRPTSSQFLKEPLSVNNKEISLENFFTNQRKGSIKWKKQPPALKQNFGNKQNQRQRRMSQKAPSSKPSTIVSKKTSTKFLKPNASFASQQSVHSMLQSHLQNSNKFLVGAKKQEVKYDGEKMALGQQQIRHGHGILYYSNGLIYQGQFFHNKRQGFGLLKFNHVQLYSGQWQNDQLSGKGKIRNCAIINKKKKQLTQGTSSSNSNINPLNTNMFAKWISYCGEFMNNRFEGEGTLYLQGGEKFVGWFRNGVADGEGSLYRKNGEVENGVWRNNVLVERYSL